MEGTSSDGMTAFVQATTGAVTGQVTLTTVATTVGVIITAGIISIVAWRFARKGYRFVVNALSGRSGKI